MSLKLTNLVGFGGGGGSAIAVIDDGGDDDFKNTTIHTYTSRTCTGPACYISVGWISDTVERNLNSMTFNGNTISIKVQRHRAAGIVWHACAIGVISGAQSGNLVFNFSGTVTSSYYRLLSARNVRNTNPTDTDSYSSDTNSITLSALIPPSSGGLEIAAMVLDDTLLPVTWTPSPEVKTLFDGAPDARWSVAYRLGGLGGSGDIKWTAAGDNQATVGVALR